MVAIVRFARTWEEGQRHLFTALEGSSVQATVFRKLGELLQDASCKADFFGAIVESDQDFRDNFGDSDNLLGLLNDDNRKRITTFLTSFESFSDGDGAKIHAVVQNQTLAGPNESMGMACVFVGVRCWEHVQLGGRHC